MQRTSSKNLDNLLSWKFCDFAKEKLRRQDTLVVPNTTLLRNVLTFMQERGIRSCIVEFRESRESCTLECASERFRFLDMRDVAKFILLKVEQHYANAEAVKTTRPLIFNDFVRTFLEEKVEELAGIAGRNAYLPVINTATLKDAIKAFNVGAKTIVFSRLPSGGIKVDRVFSVTDFFEYISSHSAFQTMASVNESESDNASELEHTLDMTTAEGRMQLASQLPASKTRATELIVTLDKDPLLVTLKRLVDTGYAALPVVSTENMRRCISVISVRDFMPLLTRPEEYKSGGQLFLGSTLAFVSMIRQIECLKAVYPTINIRDSAPIRHVLAKITVCRIHRVLLLDDNGLLTGIVSVTDLGKMLAAAMVGSADTKSESMRINGEK